MGAATSVTNKAGIAAALIVASGYCTVDLASIAAAGREVVTIAVPQAKLYDAVIVNPRATLTAGLVISQAYVSAAGTITFVVENHSAGIVDQTSTVFDWTIIRGNQGPSAHG